MGREKSRLVWVGGVNFVKWSELALGGAKAGSVWWLFEAPLIGNRPWLAGTYQD